jgi:hypothetical protein
VAEMDAGFQHLTHRDRHYYTPLSGLSLDPRLGPCAWHDGHPDGADLRIAWILKPRRTPHFRRRLGLESCQSKLTFDFNTLLSASASAAPTQSQGPPAEPKAESARCL